MKSPKIEGIDKLESPAREIFRTSLLTDQSPEELRLTLFSSPEVQWLNIEVFNRKSTSPGDEPGSIPARQITLPVSLWPRFYEAVCCLGSFMKPLPAPAYQPRSCCSCLCPPTPEPVLLTLNPQAHLHLCLEDRRGSTFLEIKAVKPSNSGDSGEAETIRIGPTLWSAFFAAIQEVDRIIADL